MADMQGQIRDICQKEKTGFTLMELMVVVAIIGLLAAISIPMLLNPEHRVRTVARQIMGDMQGTRMAAIKNNENWAIVFEPDNLRYLVCSDRGKDNSWSKTEDNTIVKTVVFSTHVSGVKYGHGQATFDATLDKKAFPADDISYSPNVLTFNPRGSCQSGWVYIDYKGVSYAVGTLSTGIVRIRRWYSGDWQ